MRLDMLHVHVKDNMSCNIFLECLYGELYCMTRVACNVCHHLGPDWKDCVVNESKQEVIKFVSFAKLENKHSTLKRVNFNTVYMSFCHIYQLIFRFTIFQPTICFIKICLISYRHVRENIVIPLTEG